MRRAGVRQVVAGGFVAVLLAVVLVLDRTGVIGGGDGPGDGDDPPASPEPAVDEPSGAGTASGVPGAATPTAPGDTVPSGSPAVDVGRLESLAEDAVVAWQIPTVAERAEALEEVATDDYVDAATSIDPAVVPTAPPGGAAFRLESDGQALVTVTLVDGTELDVILARADGGWRVDDIRSGTPPGAREGAAGEQDPQPAGG